MRYWCALLALLMIGISACSSQDTPVVTSFCADVDMIYQETAFKGTMKCIPHAETTVSLTSPDELNGMCLRWNGTSMSTCLGDAEFSPENAPNTALPVLLHAVFKDIEAKGGNTQGEVYGWRYECCFDEQSGFPVSLTIRDVSLAVGFSEVIRCD